MFGTRRAQPVHKTGLLHLPALSGEDMHKFNHLMHDLRSEFSKNIKSYNMAINATMNRDLSQALRDMNSTIENLNRSQQTTYKAMCRIVQTQRRRVKETYQQYQQRLRDGDKTSKQSPHYQFKKKMVQGQKLPPLEPPEPEVSQMESSQTLERLTEPPPNPTLPHTESAAPTNPTESSEMRLKTNEHHEPTEEINAPPEDNSILAIKPQDNELANSLKQAEKDDWSSTVTVSGSPAKPFLELPSRSTVKKAFFTASLRPTLPPITESLDLLSSKAESTCHREVMSEERRQQLEMLGLTRAQNTYAVSSKGGGSSIGRVSDTPDYSVAETAASAQKATSLRAKIAEIERQNMKEFLRKQNLETKLKPYQVKSDSETDNTGTYTSVDDPFETSGKKVNGSIAAERRKLKKLRAAHRKAVLNSENSYVYSQLSDGSFLQGARAYTRKRFLPPSNRAKHEREQIMKSEAARAEMNDEKIGQFFNKIDLSEPKEISKKVLKRKENKAVINLADIIPVVVVEPMQREDSIKPLTEVSKGVAYIRQYIRPSERTNDGPANTSWEQKY